MKDDDSSIWGVIGVIVVIAIIIWSAVSSSQQQQNTDHIAIIENAVMDINSRIDDLYSSAEDTSSAIDDECSWQSDELSGNIGDVCSSNTGQYALDGVSDYYLDESTYVSMLDDDTSIDDIVSQLVDDANANYSKIVDTMDGMTSALNDQCSWIEDNIDDEIASECYDAGDDFDYDSLSPFDIYDYLDA